jgi:hypothetical protein
MINGFTKTLGIILLLKNNIKRKEKFTTGGLGRGKKRGKMGWLEGIALKVVLGNLRLLRIRTNSTRLKTNALNQFKIKCR